MREEIRDREGLACTLSRKSTATSALQKKRQLIKSRRQQQCIAAAQRHAHIIRQRPASISGPFWSSGTSVINLGSDCSAEDDLADDERGRVYSGGVPGSSVMRPGDGVPTLSGRVGAEPVGSGTLMAWLTRSVDPGKEPSGLPSTALVSERRALAPFLLCKKFFFFKFT
jgi:hypothetical protein